MPPDEVTTTARLEPRDASTLLLLDRTPSGIRVLLGRRREDLAFAPGAYVFPGGRAEREDGIVPAAIDVPDRLSERLMDRMRRGPSRRRARGLVAAAVRETAEETGYLVGRQMAPGSPSKLGGGYGAFADAGVELDLSMLVLVGRAITPIGRPRRFDARFFAAFADDVLAAGPNGAPADGELADVRFVPLAETPGLGLHRMTTVMLEELERRLAVDPRLKSDRPAPFYVPRGQRIRREEI